ncbi:MAG: EAL domain protein [Marinobacter excellens HL-55]|uniref:EAL domain protein n=1 Tax=Marinobacter excellens HL-55 TaxID=1305731 RepID=A0A0P8BL50_9GAMM|nr:MAG: EAL domain protein [Marinobacter excellens HL-55]
MQPAQHEVSISEKISRLQSVIESQSFELAFQPKFRSSGAICGVEALARWPNAVAAWQQPEEFVRLAERESLSVALDLQILAQAIKLMRSLPSSINDHLTPLSVNVSAASILDPLFIRSLERILSVEHPIRLTLELTETAPLQSLKKAKRVFDHLAQLGVSLSIDDFLYGYNDIGVLSALPANEVKIDRKDVALIHERSSFQRVAAIITIARQRNLFVTAEGIENDGQWSLLKSMGCDFCQGFWLAPPMNIKDLAAFASGRAQRLNNAPARQHIGTHSKHYKGLSPNQGLAPH